MMIRLLAAGALALALAAPAAAQVANAGSRATLVVDAKWVDAHLRDPDLVLLQVGTKDTYDKGHIPGARFADTAQLRNADPKPGELTLEMPPAQKLHDALESFGISDKSHVVVYASDEWWSPTTRVLMTLDYAGIGNVSYLDGGLKGWVDGGHAVSTDAPPAAKGTLSPLKLRPVVVDADFVQAHEKTPGFVIVDARSTQFYDGTAGGGQRGQEKKFGHIPGAVSAPYDSFASGDGQLKSDAEIAAVLDKAGVKKGDTVVAYCHIGQQATAVLFAARTRGHNVLLYDGSFEDWNARNLPLENPKK
jgi:thiosulfate/3-mercaptopyruvate sulfurtransferase